MLDRVMAQSRKINLEKDDSNIFHVHQALSRAPRCAPGPSKVLRSSLYNILRPEACDDRLHFNPTSNIQHPTWSNIQHLDSSETIPILGSVQTPDAHRGLHQVDLDPKRAKLQAGQIPPSLQAWPLPVQLLQPTAPGAWEEAENQSLWAVCCRRPAPCPVASGHAVQCSESPWKAVKAWKAAWRAWEAAQQQGLPSLPYASWRCWSLPGSLQASPCLPRQACQRKGSAWEPMHSGWLLRGFSWVEGACWARQPWQWVGGVVACWARQPWLRVEGEGFFPLDAWLWRGMSVEESLVATPSWPRLPRPPARKS